MKTTRYLIRGSLFLCFFLSFTETFGASSARTGQQDTEKPSLDWIHKDTGRKIFDLEDIVAFDWDKGLFQLKEEAAMNMRLYPVGTKPDLFEIRSGDQVIYEGLFANLLCSNRISQGPVIEEYHFLEKDSFLFHILTQNCPDYDQYSKPLKQILSDAGLLKVINPSAFPARIARKTYTQGDPQLGLYVSLEIFTDTFIIGLPARFHFRLTSPKAYPDGDYVIETLTTLTANGGRYTKTVRRVFPVTQKYLWASHPVGFVLYALVKDGKREEIEAGPAQLVMEFTIRRVLNQKQDTYSEPIEILQTEPIAINILAPKYNPMPPEAESVMDNFRQALREQNWQKALTLCSDAVQQKAKTQPLEDFFETYTPLEKLLSDEEYHISGQSYIDKTSPEITRQYTGFECFMTLSKPDQRPCLNWTWKLNKNQENNSWTIDFAMISVSEQMESERSRLLAEQQRAEEFEQQRHKGLKATLVPILQDYVIGKPMLFRLEVVNVSSSVITISGFPDTCMINNPLSVTDPDGQEVLYVGGSTQTSGMHKNFEPGRKEILAQEYDATTQYRIILPGQYSFRYRGGYGFPPSEEVKLIIKPGKMNPKEEIAAKILSIKPNDWRLSYAGRMSHGSAETSTHLNLMIAMDAFTLKGQFSVSLHIFIDPGEDTLANFASWVPEKIGQSQWGSVYICESKTDLFWPDCRESLIRALNIQTEK